MKKILLMSVILASSSLQADIKSAPLTFYGGAGLIAASTNSDFSMDYTANKDDFPSAHPYANHKEKHMGRVGGELFFGVKSTCQNGWFWASELSYGLTKSNHKHDFIETEDAEEDPTSNLSERISYIDIKHGDELGLVGKFGRSVNFWNIYGILGVTVKKVEIKYGLDGAHPHIDKSLEADLNKRVYGAVFGVGVSRRIHDNISCGIEYKYKLYQNAKKSANWTTECQSSFGNLTHDNSDRNFKVKSHKHEFSLRFALNI